MDPVSMARGFVLGFTIAATVGPISLLVIRRTLSEGRAVGLASGLGVATADATYGGIAAFGLTAITSLLVGGGRLLGLVGGIFLVWLAWRIVRSAPTGPAVVERRGGLAGAYLSILALTLTNPLTILSFGALFAGLGLTGGTTANAALLTLGVLAGSVTWWLILTTALTLLASQITEGWLRAINLGSGIMIGAFGLVAIGLAIHG